MDAAPPQKYTYISLKHGEGNLGYRIYRCFLFLRRDEHFLSIWDCNVLHFS